MSEKRSSSQSVKDALRDLPWIGPALVKVRQRVQVSLFKGSPDYWEDRYRNAGTSGAGSYGRLAVFKADALNRFVTENHIGTVLEFGCGDGNQLSLANYPSYVGLDVSRRAIELCSERFHEDNTKSFLLYDSLSFSDRLRILHADLTISLDVIFHLIEDHIFEAYMQHLFAASDRFVIIYSSNHDDRPAPHVRDRHLTAWISRHLSDWRLIEEIPNAFPFDPDDTENTSHSIFLIYAKAQSE